MGGCKECGSSVVEAAAWGWVGGWAGASRGRWLRIKGRNGGKGKHMRARLVLGVWRGGAWRAGALTMGITTKAHSTSG